jgi:hypothetical protein
MEIWEQVQNPVYFVHQVSKTLSKNWKMCQRTLFLLAFWSIPLGADQVIRGNFDSSSVPSSFFHTSYIYFSSLALIEYCRGHRRSLEKKRSSLTNVFNFGNNVRYWIGYQIRPSFRSRHPSPKSNRALQGRRYFLAILAHPVATPSPPASLFSAYRINSTLP